MLARWLLAGLIVGMTAWLNVGYTQSDVLEPETRLPLTPAVRLQPAPDSPDAVPGVVGAPLEVAVEQLAARDFIPQVVSGPAGDPRARVTGQDPPGGATPPRDRLVRLWVGIEAAEGSVPDVVGKSVPAAVERLAARDLLARMVSGPADDPRARVTGQDPPGGASRPRDRVVRLWVGIRAAERVVPHVVGDPAPNAVERLAVDDFIARIVSGPADDPRARVTGQDPLGGARPPQDRIVRLWVGIEEAEGVVPDVVGVPVPNAVEQLAVDDFITRIVSGPADDPRARVTGQDPPGGARPPRDRVVQLWVGVDEQGVEVPPVEGRTAAEAEQIIQRRELQPVFVDGEVRGDAIVVDQQPRPGSLAPPGSAVQLWVRVPDVEVPPVTDMALADALRTLRRHKLRADIDRDGAGRTDQVIDQEPEAGAMVPAGSRVFLRTEAPESTEVPEVPETPAIVPDVMNLDQDAAFREIQAAGLTPRVAESETTRGGHVIRQAPLGGTEVRPGAPVTLWLSAPSGRPDGGRGRGDRDSGGDQSGRGRIDDPPTVDDGDGRDGIGRDLLIALAAGLGGLAIGGLAVHRISSRRRLKKRRIAQEQITFEPHTGTPDARTDDRLAVRTEIRLEPVPDVRGEQTTHAEGALVSNWEELP